MATATESRPKPAAAPSPSPPPEPAHTQGQAQAQAKDQEHVDYYGYLYEANKTPTKTFDAVLRAIGQHIIENVGDRKDKVLKPAKLAAFYKEVGGDYDKLFVHAPHESISYIWQVFGCRHTLEPTDSDTDAPWNFEPPTIPAVTLRGFVRWESIQVLLTPDEHVPFILHALHHWNLRHPDTGELFPADITAAAFPSEPDAEISAWYESCGEKLRKEAAPKASPSPRPPFPSAQDRVHVAFTHVRAPGRAGTPDYFSHHRSVPFAHVSPGHATRHTSRGFGLRVSPDRIERPERMRYNGLTPQEERARRRSFSDYPSPHASPTEPLASTHLNPPRPTAARRHSHPRRVSTDPDDDDDGGGGGGGYASPRPARRGSAPHHRSPKPVPRFVHIAVPASGPPSGFPPAVPVTGSPILNIRTEGGGKTRPDDRGSPIGGPRVKHKSGVEGAKDFFKGKISSIFPGASPVERPAARKSPAGGGGSNGSRDSLGRSRSYDDGNSDSDSEHERERRRRRRVARERERERERREREAATTASYERERLRRSREDVQGPADWEDSAGRLPRSRKDKERYILRRPDAARRTSSHADVDRLERERMVHRYEYADDSSGRRRGARGRGGPLEDERRGSPRDRTASPVIKGVGGRRYPAPAESPPL